LRHPITLVFSVVCHYALSEMSFNPFVSIVQESLAVIEVTRTRAITIDGQSSQAIECIRTKSSSHCTIIIINMDEAYRYSCASVGKAERTSRLNRSIDESPPSSEDQASVQSIYESDCLTTTGSSSSSGGGADDEEEEDDDDSGEDQGLERQIDYLRQKQRILLRASRFFAAEDAYNAAHASVDAKGPRPDPKDSVWSQAKEYLLLHGLDEADSSDDAEQPSSTDSFTHSHDVHGGVRCPTTAQSRNHHHPLIDTSIVHHISSKHYAMVSSSPSLGRARPVANG
jgi:hypothetical protein